MDSDLTYYLSIQESTKESLHLELTDVTRMWEEPTFKTTGTSIVVFIVTSVKIS